MKKILSLVLALAMLMSVVGTASAAEITDLITYETTNRELEIFNILLSQEAKDLNVLTNCYDPLLTNDNKGGLVGCAAKEWESPDGGMTWTFKLNEGMKWVNQAGEIKADVVAEDWLWGLEWVLNFAKNGAANTSMPIEMIQGAGDYYEYTKSLAETDKAAAEALDLTKFLEMVKVSAPDTYTLTYVCTDKLSYFPTVCTYNCLYPVSGAYLAEVGVEGFKTADFEKLWYSGPYTVTSYIYQNEKILTKNPNYWNDANVKRFNTVTIKMAESSDSAYQIFQTGEIQNVQLSQSALTSIYESESNEFHNYLVEMRPTKYSYQWHINFAKNLESGEPDVNWNTAVANEAFRKSIYYGIDMTNYLKRTNAINPQSCQNYCFTANNLCITSDGKDYTQLVRDNMGLQYSTESYTRYDAEKAAAFKAQAIEELTKAGVTFPVELDWYIKGDSQTAKDTADVMAEMFKDYLGEDYIKFVTKTYVSSQNKEVRDPRLQSLNSSGWGADFGDPINFLGQITYNDDNAYYANYWTNINKATDPTLIATFQEFTDKVNAAKAITDDLDARYKAFAEAEAFLLDHALDIPAMYEVAWQLTSINDYSKVYAQYGIQAYRYVNWETNADLYTAEDYAKLAEAYNAQ